MVSKVVVMPPVNNLCNGTNQLDVKVVVGDNLSLIIADEVPNDSSQLTINPICRIMVCMDSIINSYNLDCKVD